MKLLSAQSRAAATHCCCALRPRVVSNAAPASQPQRHMRHTHITRWAPDSKEDEPEDAAAAPDAAAGSSSETATRRRLINQLLAIQSLASLQSMDQLSPAEEQELSAAVAQALQQQQQQGQQHQQDQQPSLFEDPAMADFDPHVLDLLGFTSVADFLDSNLATAASEAKVAALGVAAWSLLAAAMMAPLGGPSAYTDSMSILTDGGLEMRNLLFLWVGLLTYYSSKGCVMAFVLSVRSWRLHEAQGERLEELAATVQLSEQRRAFWKLQGALQKADLRAKRTYTEFALSSLLLGVLLLMSGGTDHLALQLETVDIESFLSTLVICWLGAETYFASVGAVVKVGQWAAAGLSKWQNRKWGGARGGSAGARGKQ